MKETLLTVAICSYNRIEYLKYCLESLFDQCVEKCDYEVIVIDNNSDDGTDKFVQDLTKTHSNLCYLNEQKQGLSHARNRAIKACRTEWVSFIDDDVVVGKNYIKRALELIKKSEYKFIGGRLIPKYIGDKPKWLPESFNSFGLPVNTLVDAGDDYVIGASMLMNKKLILDIGLFPANLGMKADQIRYAEEDQVQQKLRASGHKIAYDPSLVAEHIVHKDKYKLIWHFRSSYAHGRDRFIMKNESSRFFSLLLKLTRSTLAGLIKRLPVNFIYIILKPGFYWQNGLIRILHPILFVLGEMEANKIIRSK